MESLTKYLDMNKIINEEEEDNVVFSIREEIIGNALNEIDEVSKNTEAMRMVAETAVEALKRVIALHFYYHIETVNSTDSVWRADEPTPPSPADTWASKLVAIRPRPRAKEKKEEEEKELKPCECNLGVDCLCLRTPEQRVQREKSTFVSFSKPMTKTKSSLIKVESEIATIEPTPSLKSDSFADLAKKKISQLSKVTKDSSTRLPKIEPSVVEIKPSLKVVELELPPIRIETTYQSIHLGSPPKPPAKKDKR